MNRIFRIRSRSVEEFKEDCLDTSDLEEQLLLQEAYREYMNYCKTISIPPVSYRRFPQDLRNCGLLIEAGTDHKAFIKGAKLQNDENSG